MQNYAAILIASHPRSGTHLALDLIRRNFPQARSRRLWGKPLDHLYLNLERTTSAIRHFDEALAQKVFSRAEMPLMKTHYLSDFSESWIEAETGALSERWRELIESALVIYIHRDPRDVMVSYKQFLSPMATEVSSMSLSEFIRSPHWTGNETRLDWWVRHVESWITKQNVVSLSYRDIVSQPQQILFKISNHTGLRLRVRAPPLPPKVTTLARTRWDRLTSLSPSSTSIIADRHRFPAIDWRAELDEADHSWIHSQAGKAMTRLGYNLISPDQGHPK